MPGFKNNGQVDLRKAPKIIRRKLTNERADGQAWQLLHSDAGQPSDTIEPILEVDSRLKNRVELETFIHEAMHLGFPWMQEQAVLQGARYIALCLWKAGYRLEKEPA